MFFKQAPHVKKLTPSSLKPKTQIWKAGRLRAFPPKGEGKCKEIDFGNSGNSLEILMMILKGIKGNLKFNLHVPQKAKSKNPEPQKLSPKNHNSKNSALKTLIPKAKP